MTREPAPPTVRRFAPWLLAVAFSLSTVACSSDGESDPTIDDTTVTTSAVGS